MPPEIEPALLRRLEHLMVVERAYRREGLTIGSLSAELGVPEYRLRQLINEGLGHRNFNAFLNRYRIEEAKAALADPEQGRAGADDRHGCRFPVDRALQPCLQGSHRSDTNRIPASRSGEERIYCAEGRCEFKNRQVGLKNRPAEFRKRRDWPELIG